MSHFIRIVKVHFELTLTSQIDQVILELKTKHIMVRIEVGSILIIFAVAGLDVLFKDGNFQKQDLMHYHRAWSSKWGDDLEWLKVGWHLLMVMPNSLIKYAALDEETKEFFTHMFVGSMPAAKIKNKVLALIAKGVLKHDVLSLMTGKKGVVPELAN